MQYDKNKDEVHLTYYTWGKTHDVTTSRKHFLQDFCGMVAGKAPSTLTQKPTPKMK